MAQQRDPAGRPTGGVQSIARVFDLLEAMTDLGGIATLSELAQRSGLPVPTIHRLVRTLVDLGYVRQEPSRAYALAPRLVRLGDQGTDTDLPAGQVLSWLGDSDGLRQARPDPTSIRLDQRIRSWERTADVELSGAYAAGCWTNRDGR